MGRDRFIEEVAFVEGFKDGVPVNHLSHSGKQEEVCN